MDEPVYDVCMTLELRRDGKILQSRSVSVVGKPLVRSILWDAASGVMDLAAMAGLGTPADNLRSADSADEVQK